MYGIIVGSTECAALTQPKNKRKSIKCRRYTLVRKDRVYERERKKTKENTHQTKTNAGVRTQSAQKCSVSCDCDCGGCGCGGGGCVDALDGRRRYHQRRPFLLVGVTRGSERARTCAR